MNGEEGRLLKVEHNVVVDVCDTECIRAESLHRSNNL